MNRREILKYTAWVAGGTIAAPVVASLLSGCQSAPTATPFAPSFFNAGQFDFIKLTSGTILPNGEIPGAVEVGVPQVIDHMVGVVYSPEDRKSYARGVDLLMHLFSGESSVKSFSEMTPALRRDWLKDFEITLNAPLSEEEKNVDLKKIVLVNDAGEANQLTVAEEKALRRSVYLQLKQQTIAYFLSSEEISMNHLNYLPVPGKYEACISLESVGGKAWAI